MSSQILRFDRSDEKDSFILVHLTHNGSTSTSTLDLTLTATEGEAAYRASIKQSRLNDLKSKSYDGSEEEWCQVIRTILGQATDNKPRPFKIEATAAVSESGGDDQIIITIRKKVQDITQRLGSITLKQGDHTIELFEWAGTAAARTLDLEQKVTDLNSRYESAEDTVQRLTQQLEDLVQAKAEHENQLIANFTHLLNEKKLKIRNQQHLLASATPDPTKVAEIQASALDHASPGPRTTKRAHDETDDESDDFEPMDTDNRKTDKSRGSNDQNSDAADQSTPEPEDGGQTTTDDESEEEAPQRPALERPAPSTEGKAPPRRELPFTRRGPPTTRSTAEPESVPAGDETGDSDDDEL